MAEPIVLQLQTDCLDPSTPTSTLLRKAKLIASKLNLNDTEDWLEAELNGYQCALKDLPPYRKGLGQPKFFNPYHGWLDITLANAEAREMVSSAFLSQAIAEIEHLAAGEGNFIILGFMDPINNFLNHTLNIPFNCGLHLSKAVLIGAIEGVKNLVLDWALKLEASGVVGQGLSFSSSEKEKAQTVTNHIYNSNVGVLGSVGGSNTNSEFALTTSLDTTSILKLVEQIREAAPGLPKPISEAVVSAASELEQGALANDSTRIGKAIDVMKEILQGAGGNLAASGILAAIGAS